VTGRDRRALARGAAVVLAAVLLLRVVPAGVRAVAAARERAGDRLSALARSRDLVREVPALRDSLATALAGVVALAPRLLGGGTRAEASATLSALLSLQAGRSDLKVLRLAPTGDSSRGILQPVGVQVEFEGDAAGLTAFLVAVERGNPLLSVVTLAITSPEAVSRPGSAEALHIEVEVRGWFLARTEP
jgi:hypothetical protein